MFKSISISSYIRLLLAFCGCLLMAVSYQAVADEDINKNFTIVQALKMQPMQTLSSAQCHGLSTDDSAWPLVTFSSIKPQQHLCLRAALQITEHNLPKNPALLLVALAAYEVRINGQLLGINGEVGNSVSTEKVGAFNSLFSLDSSQLIPGKHLLSIEFSSFLANPSFSAIGYLMMVTDQQSLSQTLLTVTLVTAMLTGGLLILFVIFFVLYISFSRESSYFIFSLLCLFTAVLLVAEQWKLWVNYAYDWHLIRLRVIIAITLVVTSLLPIYYLWQHQSTRKLFWITALLMCAVGVLFFAQSYDARSEWLFIISLLFVLAINLVAWRQQKPFAKTALAIGGISLLSLFIAPLLFLELGFALAICMVLGSIGLSLLQQLRLHRDRALETGRVKGELLRRNLQPHYLMNCLMQAQELIEIAPQQANAFVAELADEFRALVKMSDKGLVTLEDEIALCQSHLKIMSIRYQQQYRLNLGLDGALNAMDISVPSAILHSQIENCFTHNRISGDEQLQLEASCDNGKINLVLKTPISNVIDHKGLGLGEAYIKAKMAEVCAQGWKLTSAEEDGFWVTRYQYRVASGSSTNGRLAG